MLGGTGPAGGVCGGGACSGARAQLEVGGGAHARGRMLCWRWGGGAHGGSVLRRGDKLAPADPYLCCVPAPAVGRAGGGKAMSDRLSHC